LLAAEIPAARGLFLAFTNFGVLDRIPPRFEPPGASGRDWFGGNCPLAATVTDDQAVLRKERSNVRITLISAGLAVIGLAAFAFTHTWAQAPAQRPAAPTAGHHGIAVIDITFILDNHPRLQQATDAFKRDVEAMGKQFKSEQDAIVKSAEKLKSFNAGSPEYKKLEEQLAQQQSDLKVKAALKEKEFAERESKTYLAAYQEITNLVRVYAERNGISLVLRFNGKPVDPNNRDAIRAELFKTVMYNDPAIDITDQILAELRRNSAAPTATRPGTPGARPR
jgi:Skp family chaperone for outer membrane proteins